MSASTPFLIDDTVRAALDELRQRAALRPVDVRGLVERLADPALKAAHMAQMNEQSVLLPFGYLVTFSIEIGHPKGEARHMSLSSPTAGRVPNYEAVWLTAEALGFVGSLADCAAIWPEELQGHGAAGHGIAINVVQLLSTQPTSRELFAERQAPPPPPHKPPPQRFDVQWLDAGREPQERPDPAFPNGKHVDLTEGAAPSCSVALPYPAPRCGAWRVACKLCGLSIAATAAGRPDDPRSLRLACKSLVQ